MGGKRGGGERGVVRGGEGMGGKRGGESKMLQLHCHSTSHSPYCAVLTIHMRYYSMTGQYPMLPPGRCGTTSRWGEGGQP